MYQEGDVIQLDDGLHYAVVHKIEMNGKVYLNLLSITKPINIKFLEQKEDEQGALLEEVTNKEELDTLLKYISELDIEED